MQLVKYNPLRDFQRLERNFDKLWGADWHLFPNIVEPSPVDMYEEEGTLVTKIALPNFSKNEIEITVHEGMIEITARHEEKGEERDSRHYYLHESSNQYLRRIPLPENVTTESTEAMFSDGVLTIRMPAAIKQETTNKIPIQ